METVYVSHWEIKEDIWKMLDLFYEYQFRSHQWIKSPWGIAETLDKIQFKMRSDYTCSNIQTMGLVFPA